MKRLLCLVVCVFGMATAVQAQPMAEDVPEDAIFYVGWMGYDAFTKSAAYQQSHMKAIMKAIMEATNQKEQAAQYLKAMTELIGREDPNSARNIQQMMPFMEALSDKPMLMYVGKFEVDPKSNQPPRIPAALILDCGKDADLIEKTLSELTAQAKQYIAVRRLGNRVAVTTEAVSTQQLARMKLTRAKIMPSPSLTNNAGFSKAFKGMASKKPAVAAYVDLKQIQNISKTTLGKLPKQKAQGPGGKSPLEMYEQVATALGLNGLDGIAVAGGLDGKNWSTEILIAAPAPRKGLLGRVGQKPIDAKALQMIPGTAMTGGAVKFDPAAIYDELRMFVQKFDPNAAKQMEKGLAEVKNQTGIDVENGFMRALGSDWVYYIDRNVNGTSMLGTVFINKLNDGKKFDTTLTQIANIANVILQKEMEREEFKISIKQTMYAGDTINYIALPVVTPSWSVRGDALVIGLYPQSVAGALAELKKPSKPIDARRIIKAISKDAENGRVIGFSYLNTKEFVETSYMMNVMLSRLSDGFLDMAGSTPPAMSIAPLKVYQDHLGLTTSVMWVDGAGIHIRAVEPFPAAASLMAGQNSSMTSFAMLGGMLSSAGSSMGKARTVANRTKEASNIRSIMQGCMVLAVGNNDQYPKTLGELVKAGAAGPELFVSPLNEDKTVPKLEKIEDYAKWVNENTDYVYVRPKAGLDADFKTVVLYRKFDFANNDPTDGIVIGFGDGHAKWFEYDDAINILVKQKLIKDPRKKQATTAPSE